MNVATYLNVLIEESWLKLISIGHELQIAQFLPFSSDQNHFNVH